MAKKTFNQGQAPTGIGGDTFDSGALKLMANDDELYAQMGAGEDGVLPAALPIVKGGTGGTTAQLARSALSVYSKAEVDDAIANGGGGGGVQLYDGVDSESTTAAATANSARIAYAAAQVAQATANSKTTNATDAHLLNRTNHTGTQAMSTISGLSVALDGKQDALTAGKNITIADGVISAAAGAGGVPATETVAGIAKIATTGVARGGTDDGDFLTSKKVASINDFVYVDKTASRELRTTYVNDKPYPRHINITSAVLINTSLSLMVSITKGGVTQLLCVASAANTGRIVLGGSIVIPPRASYNFGFYDTASTLITSTVIPIAKWLESEYA